jgi:hypothetical protein
MNQKPPTSSSVSKTTRRIIWGIVIIIICIPVFLIFSFFGNLGGLYFFGSSKAVHEADAGFRKAKETIDPERLRAWALEEISKKERTNTNPPDSDIPIYIRNLYIDDPPEAFVVDTNIVTIYWGGGLFHWMIDVGDTNYTESTGVVENHFTTVEWVPGIYYTREDTRHPFK